MKKIIALCLAFILTGFLPTLSLAAEVESEEIKTVLSIVKERIASTEEYDKFTSSVQERNGIKYYSFNWSSDEVRLNITANAKGVITSYSRYYDDKPNQTDKPTINKLLNEEALNKTKELLKALNPDIADELVLYSEGYESLYNNGYSFRIKRVHNEIDVVGDTGYIRVDKDAKNIESFSLTYTDNLKFDDSDNIIDKATAIEKYKSELGMVLSYKINNKKAELIYEPKVYDKYISAVTGEAIAPILPQYDSFRNEASKDMIAGGGGGGSSFTEAELKNLDIINTLISKEDTEAFVKSNQVLKINKGATLEYFYLNYNASDKKYYYSMDFSDEESSYHVYLDAKNGDILSYNCYSINKEEYEENIPLAKEYVEKLCSKLYTADDKGEYRFESYTNNVYKFVRYHNNIPCFDNLIYISFNKSGKVLSYSLNYSEVEFDSPSGIISEDEAVESMVKECGYKLYYYPSLSSKELKTADVAILVYDIENKNTTIDAKTGKIKNPYQNEVKVGNYTDIENHYAKDIIKTLSKFGIGFPEDEFMPDKEITFMEYVVLITSVIKGNEGIILKNSDTRFGSYYYRAMNTGIISEVEKDPDALVSRGMAAVYMIKALGLHEVASLEGIYMPMFNDVTENIGHISILSAMGVINGFDGKFNPDKNITRADAMIMIYNYLVGNGS